MNEKNKKYLYVKGFLVTPDEQLFLHELDWAHHLKGNLNLYFHPQTNFSFYEQNENWVCVLGHTIDTINNTINNADVSKALYENLIVSQDAFFDYLERLTGRYVIITSMNKQLNVYHDATGMKSVFYHKNSATFGSHAKLVAKATGEGEAQQVDLDWIQEPRTYHYPGDYTPYNNVHFLLPNHKLLVWENKTVRYFPREELPTKTLDDVIDILVEETQKQLKLIAENYKMLVSLTAGVDSRTTLALLKDYVSSAVFFTYYYKHSKDPSFKTSKTLDIDRDVANEIIANLQLNHEIIPIDYADRTDEDYIAFKELLTENTFLDHNSILAKIYSDKYEGENYLHLRSNIYGIIKSVFRKVYKLHGSEASLEDIVTCTNPSLLSDPNAVRLYERWLEDYSPNVGLNYDPFDILFWESRMGTWHSQLVIQSDIAFETHTLINSQYLIRNLLSIPVENRSSSQYLHRLVDKQWPILSYWKYNRRGTLRDTIDADKKRIKQLTRKQAQTKAKLGLPNHLIEYSAGNLYGEMRVPYKIEKKSSKELFYIDKPAPKKGDFARANIRLLREEENADKAYLVFLELSSPYQNKKNKGRLKYEVMLNDEPLLEEDVAEWNKTNQIFIQLPDMKENTLSIQVQAMKDCEEWNWGKAARIQIESIDILEVPESISKKVICSSPYSVTVLDQEKESDEQSARDLTSVIKKLLNR